MKKKKRQYSNPFLKTKTLDDALNFYNSGVALKAAGQFSSAIEYYEQAIRLKSDFWEAYYNKANAHKELKQFKLAEENYKISLDLNPNLSIAHFSLGNLYREIGNFDAAISCFKNAIFLNHEYSEAYANLGVIFKELKDFTKAVACFDKAYLINPSTVWLEGMRIQANQTICNWHEFSQRLLNCRESIDLKKASITPFASFLIFDDPRLHLISSEIYSKAYYGPRGFLETIPKRNMKGKLKIGYFSTDLHQHPVSIWLAEQLENHDKSKFELFAFCLHDILDSMQERLKTAFDHWIVVEGMSDLEVASLSRELQIDIALDLNGYTTRSRTGIFAARAAPIQVSHLGFPGSMGAEYIDYMFGQTPSPDEDLEELAANRQFITEKIAYIPSGFTYDRQRQLSDEPLTRAQFGLPETGFVFTCQNGCQKLTPEVFDIWMEILKAVPGSVLWLLKPNDTAEKNLIKEANARGVEGARLIFTAREVVPIDQEKARIGRYLASYKLADLFLDTWPYNAGTTAIDALWAGLPVLTKVGRALVARMATEALRSIKVPELITRTPQAYQALAIELAHNPEKLGQLKDKVQANRLTTALFDPVGNTRHIENAYLEMHRRYQEGLPPEDFYV